MFKWFLRVRNDKHFISIVGVKMCNASICTKKPQHLCNIDKSETEAEFFNHFMTCADDHQNVY